MPQRKVEIIWEEEEKFIRNVVYKVGFDAEPTSGAQWVWFNISEITDYWSDLVHGIRAAHYSGGVLECDTFVENIYLE